MSALLLIALRPAAATAGLAVYQAVNVRLKADRIPIGDLVIVEPTDPGALVVDAASVRLVSEIVSPSNAATDRVLKMHYYAEAGIPYYLLVEQEPLALPLYRLDGQHYVPHAKAEAEPNARSASSARPATLRSSLVPRCDARFADTALRIEEPVRVQIDPAALG